MSIQDTLKALKELAATAIQDGNDPLDGLADAEYLCLTCEPPLAPAAINHLMAQFVRRVEHG